MDTVAPAYDPAASALGFWRRGLAQGAGYAIPALCFLLIPLLMNLGAPWPRLALLSLALAATGFFAVGWAWITHWPESARWLWLLGLMLAVAAVAIVTDSPAIAGYYGVYVAAASAALLPWVQARIVILAVSVTAAGLALSVGDGFAVLIAIMGLGIAMMTAFTLESTRKDRLLRDAERRTAVLAVAAERERIGRDLHDILGHSLTAIAVKADLAGRLVGRDDAAAATEVAALADIARQALADVRATASGMREVRLASEVASARSVLTAAGVEASVPSALPSLPDEASELLGYVVREAVTNVVRHALASHCTIACDEGGVSVSDDGTGMPAGQTGSGLDGLRERLAVAGGTLTVDSTAAGTTVSARLEAA